VVLHDYALYKSTFTLLYYININEKLTAQALSVNLFARVLSA